MRVVLRRIVVALGCFGLTFDDHGWVLAKRMLLSWGKSGGESGAGRNDKQTCRVHRWLLLAAVELKTGLLVFAVGPTGDRYERCSPRRPPARHEAVLQLRRHDGSRSPEQSSQLRKPKQSDALQ